MSDPQLAPLSIPVLAESIVTWLKQVEGIRHAQYRVSEPITSYPFAIVYPVDPETQVWSVTYEPGQQLWRGRFFVQVGVARLGETRKELAAIDPFLHRLVDHFAIALDGENITLPNLPSQPDRCYVQDIGLDRQILMGANQYAGFEFYLDTKFTRVTP